ncbi:AbrB/MazE/SpoVT family DNA-binding domain-containing protein [Lentisalinibacter salinarum]|uniref:AbrB/MazE/SpoVT family DNA-binding domain-containing protein n=1 Tax=Lentisalinibacter salinarum TaxID=2992239 RepID=UPI00386824B3
MAANIKLRKIGNSLGVILPREELDRLHLSEGDALTITRTEDGVELSPYDPEFEMKLKAFEKTRRKYRNALRELAK